MDLSVLVNAELHLEEKAELQLLGFVGLKVLLGRILGSRLFFALLFLLLLLLTPRAIFHSS